MKQIDRDSFNPANRMDSVFNAGLIAAGLVVLLVGLVSPMQPFDGATVASATPLAAQRA